MRRLNLLWLLLIGSMLHGQQITTGEYFFDDDPGIGNGMPVSVTNGSTITKSLSLPVNSLGEGFHNLSIRFKDNDGRWSHYTQRLFYILNVAQEVPQITGGEYFFNQDPGIGKGTALTLAAGNQVNSMLSLPENGLPAGFNTLAIRVKDGAGNWSHYTQRVFYIMQVPAAVAQISAAEYFIDADPGVGNGNILALSANGNTVTEALSIPVANLDQGFHTLAIRTKNADGTWGQYAQRTFYIMTNAVDAQSVVSAEYFIDTDPGVGSGASLNIPTASASISQTFAVPTPVGLSNGMHFLYIRVKNDLQKWSVTAVDTFYTDQALPVSGMELAGELHQHQVQLSWFTLTEANSQSFEVERSNNGISFAAIGTVNASGSSSSRRNYHFTDDQPLTGVNYYRLKQVDKDGRFAYSNIIVVNNKVRDLLTIIPNPATNIIRLKLDNSSASWRVAIYDAGGKFVSTHKTVNGILNISQLPKGVYFINVTNGVKQHYGRFVKE